MSSAPQDIKSSPTVNGSTEASQSQPASVDPQPVCPDAPLVTIPTVEFPTNLDMPPFTLE
jgi:hypothetical protein